jgi:hypothetical protein
VAILADTADAVIGVDTRTDTRAACLLDHMGRQVAEISAALRSSMPRAGRAARQSRAYLADRFSQAAGLTGRGNRALRDSMAWVRNAAPKLMTEAK